VDHRPPITVLVLDDEVHIRRAISDYLHDEGRFATREAATAEEALELLARQPCQVCLVDLRLRGMDGFAFIAEARRLHPGCLFFVQTGSYEADVRERAREAGIPAEQILLKPFRLEALVEAIDGALARQE
jgi:two-component system response regulator ResD